MDLLYLLQQQIENALGVNLDNERGFRFIEDGKCGHFTDPETKKRESSIITFKTKEGGIGATVFSHSPSGTPNRTFIQNPNDNKNSFLKLSEEEKKQLQQAHELKKQQQKYKERIQQDKNAKEARIALANFPILHENANLPYLNRKGIKALGNVRLGVGNHNQQSLIIPAQNIDGEIRGYQCIDDLIGKQFRTGFSPKGTFFLFGEINPDNPHDIGVLEGYATGNSTFEALDRKTPVVVAFNSGNLPEVCKLLHEKYPQHKIFGPTDNDIWANKRGHISNAGYIKMYEAMQICGGYLILPDFSKYTEALKVKQGEKGPTDFNDLYCLESELNGEDAGKKEVRRQLDEGVKIFANSKPIHFLTPEEATRKINNANHHFFYNGLVENTTNILHGGPGTGKSTSNAVEFSELVKEHPKTSAMFFVPFHEKAAETHAFLEKLGVNSIHLKGRNEDTCPMFLAIQKTVILGGEQMIFRHFCKNGENKCIHYDDCKHLNQFKEPHQAIISVHHHLPISHNKLEENLFFNKLPDFIVIDEKCDSIFYRSSTVSKEAFRNCDEIPLNIREIILTALEWEKPMLKLLRDAGITPQQIDEIIKNVPSSAPSFKDIKPGQKLEILLGKLDKKSKTPNLRAPLRLISEELLKCNREHCVGVYLHKEVIKSDWSTSFTRHQRTRVTDDQLKEAFIPVMLLDADAEPELIKTYLKVPFEIPVIDVQVEMNAEVVQLSSSSVSMESIKIQDGLKQERSSLQDVWNIAEKEIKQGGEKVLIIGPQKITGNEKQDIPPHEKLAQLRELGVDFAHYNALLGLNTFKDNTVGIVVGTNHPPTWAIEQEARAKFRLDKEPIRTGSIKVPRAYNMRDGSHKWVYVWEMRDPRCQLILKQHRVNQIGQAAGRLRTVHSPMQKRIYIITNVPVDSIVVDRLVTTQELRSGKAPHDKFEIIKQRFFGNGSRKVMPLTPTILFESVKDLFSSEKILKNWIVKAGTLHIMNFLKKDMLFNLSLFSYRVEGDRGKSKRCISACDETETKKVLQAQYGNKKVTIEGIVTTKGIIPIFVKDVWDSTLETGEQVLERIAESVEHGTNWMKSIFHTVGTILSTRKEPTAFDAWLVVRECCP